MKALLRNNYYSVRPTLNVCIYLALAVAVIFVICGSFFNESIGSIIFNYGIFAIMGSFGGLTFTMLYNNSKSKWEKFELTAPISRKDVVRSRYVSTLIFAFIAFIATSLLIIVAYFTLDSFDLERAFMGYTVGFVLLVGAPAFTHPLILKFGIDKGQLLFMISIVASLGLFMVPSILLGAWLSNFSDPYFANLVYRCSTIVISFILLLISYFISVKIYSKQDL